MDWPVSSKQPRKDYLIGCRPQWLLASIDAACQNRAVIGDNHSADSVASVCPTCGPGFWTHAAFISEMVKDGHSTIIINPDERTYRTDKQDNGSMVYEGTMHYAGFFLVRKP